MSFGSLSSDRSVRPVRLTALGLGAGVLTVALLLGEALPGGAVTGATNLSLATSSHTPAPPAMSIAPAARSSVSSSSSSAAPSQSGQVASTSTARSTVGGVRPASTVTTRSHLAPGAANPVPAHTRVVSNTPSSTWIPNQTVYALATDGTYVYLGGDFTTMTDPTRRTTQSYTRLTRVDLTTGVPDATWTPTVDGSVRALAVDAANSTIYLGGDFTTVDGQPRADLAAVSTADSGSLLDFSTGTNDVVRTLLLDGGELVVGGAFSKIGALTRNHLAKVYLPGGAVDTTFKPNINGAVFTVVAPNTGSRYAVGGNFDTVSGVSHPNLVMVDNSSGSATSWTAASFCNTPLPCQVIGLALSGNQIFLATGGSGGHVAALNLTTGANNWEITSDGDNQAVAVIQGEVFVGGHFDPKFGTAKRKTLAGVDAITGAIDPSFNPGATATWPGTWALLPTSAGLAVGGAQLNIGGGVQSRFAIFPATMVNKRLQGGVGTVLRGAHQH